jgi:hypothetical protein
MKYKNSKLENLKSEISNVIVKLRNTQPELLVRLSTKTGYKGKFYSVRKLGATGYYICTGDKPFGSWLKKKDKKNVALESA